MDGTSRRDEPRIGTLAKSRSTRRSVLDITHGKRLPIGYVIHLGDYWLIVDTLEALHRMHDVRYRMVSRGVRATPLQPHWCALRPGKCSLFK